MVGDQILYEFAIIFKIFLLVHFELYILSNEKFEVRDFRGLLITEISVFTLWMVNIPWK